MENTLEQDTSPGDLTERRSERRRKIYLRANVSGAGEAKAIVCAVLDASRSGCKIVSKEVAKLPRDICLQIGGFSDPITGQLVWREALVAGVKFIRNEANEADLGELA